MGTIIFHLEPDAEHVTSRFKHPCSCYSVFADYRKRERRPRHHSKNGEYEFFFHHNNNLLLVVRNNKCFFSSLDKDAHLEMLLQNPTELQARFMDDVSNERNRMRTDLLTVRNRFMDLRADYHCLDKRIFIMEAEPVLMNSTPQTAQPTQPTQPTQPAQPAQPVQP